jgi:hypothetical protein
MSASDQINPRDFTRLVISQLARMMLAFALLHPFTGKIKCFVRAEMKTVIQRWKEL